MQGQGRAAAQLDCTQGFAQSSLEQKAQGLGLWEPAGRVLCSSERSGIPCSRNPWGGVCTGEFTALQGQSRQRGLIQSSLVLPAEVSITGEILRLPGQGSDPLGWGMWR